MYFLARSIEIVPVWIRVKRKSLQQLVVLLEKERGSDYT